MNPLDWILIVLLLVFLFFGFRKGFLRQALSLTGIVLAFLAAARYHAPLAESSLLEGLRTHSEPLALVASFVGIFFVIAGVAATISTAIGRRLKRRYAVAELDKWLGAFVGTAKGLVVLGALAIALQEWALPQGVVVPAGQQQRGDGWVEGSLLVPWLADRCLEVIALIPQEGRDELAKLYSEKGWLRDLLDGRRREEEADATAGRVGVERLDPGTGERLRDVPEARPRPERLLDLGTWRRLVAEEEKVPAEPVPATGRLDEVSPPR